MTGLIDWLNLFENERMWLWLSAIHDKTLLKWHLIFRPCLEKDTYMSKCILKMKDDHVYSKYIRYVCLIKFPWQTWKFHHREYRYSECGLKMDYQGSSCYVLIQSKQILAGVNGAWGKKMSCWILFLYSMYPGAHVIKFSSLYVEDYNQSLPIHYFTFIINVIHSVWSIFDRICFCCIFSPKTISQ